MGPGLRDDITIHNYSSEPAGCDIELSVDADLADLFDVKGGRVVAEGIVRRNVRDGELQIEAERNGSDRGTVIRAAGAHVREDALTFRVDIPPRGHWSTVRHRGAAG